MRIIGGRWRGRTLAAPPGATTRPTADRVRQALFDMLLHAPWGGPAVIEGQTVLDAFAGTGALGLEALSRGAASAHFIERDAPALAALDRNIVTLGAAPLCRVHRADATRPPPGFPCTLVLLDPPYGTDLLPPAVAALESAGWIAPGAIIAAELGDRGRPALPGTCLAERIHGRAHLVIYRTY